jgi:hypothetical protein
VRLFWHRDALQAVLWPLWYHVKLHPAVFVLTCVQMQLDEATSSIQQLQAALARTATGAAGVGNLRVVTVLHLKHAPTQLLL